MPRIEKPIRAIKRWAEQEKVKKDPIASRLEAEAKEIVAFVRPHLERLVALAAKTVGHDDPVELLVLASEIQMELGKALPAETSTKRDINQAKDDVARVLRRLKKR